MLCLSPSPGAAAAAAAAACAGAAAATGAAGATAVPSAAFGILAWGHHALHEGCRGPGGFLSAPGTQGAQGGS